MANRVHPSLPKPSRGSVPAAVPGQVCASCAGMRALVRQLVASGIDWLDAGDAACADLEDDEREVVSEDDGIVDALTLGRAMR